MVSKRMTKNIPQQSCTGSRRALSVDLTLPACLHQQNVHRGTPNLSTYYIRKRLLLLGTGRTHVIRRVADGHNPSLAVTVPFATVCRKIIFLRIGVPHNLVLRLFFARRSSVRLCMPPRDISPVLVPTPESVGLLTSRI